MSNQRAAYCDVDGTLAATTIVTPLLWFKRRTLAPPLREFWLASLLLRGPWWLVLDRFSRHASNRAIYSHYRGMPVEQTRARARQCYAESIQPRLFARGLERLAGLQRQGVKLVLVTGSLDFLMQPLAEQLKAELIAPALAQEDGFFTGALNGKPLAGQDKANAVLQHSAANDIDLRESLAFGDAIGDLPMLETVGRPTAVNADKRLAQIARARGWPCEQWK